MQITAKNEKESELKAHLAGRPDAEARRIERFLAMPDLSRTPGSPLKELTDRLVALPDFKTFDLVETPEIVPTAITFDLFGFAADHPARSKSDTYYVDDQNILRTHTTIMWYYYLNDPEVKARLARGETIGALSYGKVYRKDEIDRKHMNVFHQIDGWLLAPKSEKLIGTAELQEVLENIAKAVFGPTVEYRFNPDTFPYTDPSLEMEIKLEDKWVEVLGSGVVRGSVLKQLGVDPEKYNGWAFGFGLERLAILAMELPDIRLLWSADPRVTRQLKLGQKYQEVSKYPPVTRDISFIVPQTFIPNNYFDLIRDLGGDLIEEVTLLDKYENAAKFGADRLSYTYRIIYRAPDKTLTTEEVESIQQKISAETVKQFGAEIR
jgi:phenylalanyl-tRNA synthetase alpha chain